jgi:hypothetical protein
MPGRSSIVGAESFSIKETRRKPLVLAADAAMEKQGRRHAHILMGSQPRY